MNEVFSDRFALTEACSACKQGGHFGNHKILDHLLVEVGQGLQRQKPSGQSKTSLQFFTTTPLACLSPHHTDQNMVHMAVRFDPRTEVAMKHKAQR